MEDELKNLIIRTAELDQAITKLLVGIEVPDIPRVRLSLAMVDISIEHAKSIRMLIYSKHFTSAMTLFRVQFEATARSIWLFYAADEEYISKHDTPLTAESDGYSDGPDLSKMLKDLETKPNVPKQASLMLAEFKSQSWRALGSYIHGGKHPLKRMQNGYPVHLLLNISRQSTGLMIMAVMTVISISGNQQIADKFKSLQFEFGDCLPPYAPKPLGS